MQTPHCNMIRMLATRILNHTQCIGLDATSVCNSFHR